MGNVQLTRLQMIENRRIHCQERSGKTVKSVTGRPPFNASEGTKG